MNDPSGTIEEAFVVARIWNTAPGDGQQALAAAGQDETPADRIKAKRWGASLRRTGMA